MGGCIHINHLENSIAGELYDSGLTHVGWLGVEKGFGKGKIWDNIEQIIMLRAFCRPTPRV